MCNCDIEAESNFLLESLAACKGPDAKTDLEMNFTVNLAFMNYFEDILEKLGKQISLNWTTQEKVLPISLETFEMSPNLINASKMLQDLAVQYRNNRNIFDQEEQNSDKLENNSKFQMFLNSFLADVLIFTAALITLIITLIII